jgi:hypothetical protein
MKRKTVVAVVMLVFCLSVLFAGSSSTNKQKIYSLDNDIYEAIALVYVSQGHSLPSTTGPYSQAELEAMLDRIDESRLEGPFRDAYEYAATELGLWPEGNDVFDFSFEASLEGYAHTNTETFVGRDSWIRGWIEQEPMITLALETWPGESFYGYSEFTVGNTYTLENGFGSTALSTNLIMVAPATFEDLDFNMPYRAFVAAGGDHWTFQLGRDRLSWGAGVSGNLFVGDNLKYHNMARFTAFGDRFKYTFLTSFFPHAQSYMDVVDETDDETDMDSSGDPTTGDNQGTVIDGITMFMAHRLEWRLPNDKVGITLTESIMYQSAENLIDLRILNPAMIFHDLYIRSNANSLLGLEIDYTPVQGLNFYGQAVVDEFSLPGETVPSETESNYPMALGYLAGAKTVFPVGDLAGYASLEFAYTDPFLYLRYQTESGATADDSDGYSLNYVGVIREFTVYGTMYYNAEFIGYKYGGDAIVINLNGGVKQYGKWNVEANAFYMWHGTFDIYTAWSQIGGDSGVPYDISTPTDEHYTENYADDDVSDRDSVSRTLVLGVNGSYEISRYLTAFGQIDYIHVANYENVSGVNEQDVQLTLGITYSR